MPQNPAPPRIPPATWYSIGNQPFDTMPLGVLRDMAISNRHLTVPSTVAGIQRRPAVEMDMLDMRGRLMRASTTKETKDGAWRHLGMLARTHKGDWNTFLFGMAFPGLSAKSREWTYNLSYQEAVRFHLDLIIEFIAAVHRLDLDKPNVASRLIGAAYDNATGRKRKPAPSVIPLGWLTQEQHARIEEGAPEHHARVLLDRLVATSKQAGPGLHLSQEQANLIAVTYFDGFSLREVGKAIKQSESNVSKLRTEANEVVARLLERPDLIGKTPTTANNSESDSDVSPIGQSVPGDSGADSSQE